MSGLAIILVAFVIESRLNHPAVEWPEHLSHLLFLVGELLFPIGTIVLIYERWLKRHTLDAAEQRLREILNDEIRKNWSDGIRHAEESGLITVHDRLDAAHIAKLIRNAKRVVRTLTPGPLEPKDLLPDAIRDSLARDGLEGLRIELILLEELTPWRDKRFEEVMPSIKEQPLGARSKRPVTAYLLKLKERGLFAERFAKRFSASVFDGTPSIDIYQIDDIAFVGFYVHCGWAFNHMCLEVRTRRGDSLTSFGRLIESEFDKVIELGVRRVGARDVERRLKTEPPTVEVAPASPDGGPLGARVDASTPAEPH